MLLSVIIFAASLDTFSNDSWRAVARNDRVLKEVNHAKAGSSIQPRAFRMQAECRFQNRLNVPVSTNAVVWGQICKHFLPSSGKDCLQVRPQSGDAVTATWPKVVGDGEEPEPGGSWATGAARVNK